MLGVRLGLSGQRDQMNAQENSRKLFEVIGEDPQLRPSPYCWRSHMALAHKRLHFESEPWHAIEKDRIAPSGGITAPVLVDDGVWVRDSWQIALYLDKTYADYPLFHGPSGRAKSLFLNQWADGILHPMIFRAVIAEQILLIAECDLAYYHARTRSKFGQTVEELGANPEVARESLKHALRPLEQTLSSTAFMGGENPDYGDYILFGTFQWARVVSVTTFWPSGSALQRWFDSLLDAFGGIGRRQKPRSAFGGTLA